MIQPSQFACQPQMSPPHHLQFALIALALAVSASAWAEGADDLRLRASESFFHDSNLFRLPSGANALALIGRSSTAETINTAAIGLNYNKAYSLQRVEFDLSYTDYRYRNFSYLDFGAVNYRGAWRWSYTPHLHGNLTTSRDETLNSFADFQGFNLRNVRVDANTRADAEYELDANWRLGGGLSQYSRKNAQPLVQEGDFRNVSADAGVRYVLASGSSVGYSFRSTEGTNTNRSLPSPGFFDNSFTQIDNDLKLNWAISPDTSAEFRAGHRSRKNPNYPQRNFSGSTGAANLSWAITGKSAVVAGWTRELGAYETSNSNFVRTDRISVGPILQVSPKSSVRVQLDHAALDYLGAPGAVFTPQRRDHTRDTSVSFDWQPFTYLALSASLQNSRRSSNLPGLDYASNMVNLSAQFTY